MRRQPAALRRRLRRSLRSLAGRVVFVCLFALAAPVAPANTAPMDAIEIELARDHPLERQAAQQLRRILASYDLAPFLFTTRVRIETGVIPHSHPVLTLNSRHLDDDDRQLATFLHEQLHWHAVARQDAVAAAIAELAARYPDVPVGAPEGARDRSSGHLHLVINLWELDALTRYLGRARARDVLARADYYTWIYATVLADEAGIRTILDRHGLSLD